MSSNWNTNTTTTGAASKPATEPNPTTSEPPPPRSTQLPPFIAPPPFTSPFTPREQELQRLLAQERARCDQRRTNYATLKQQHLALQSDFLSLQSEMKQILEETVYFKEKKNTELEELLKTIEDKSKQIERLEKQLRDSEPEVVRLKLAAELEDPLKRLAKENDRLTSERDKAAHETQLLRQQLEHAEREHLDSLDRIRLSYEAELSVVKREKEEIRARLVEASQVPDVKRLVELSEENSRLSRKLTSAQSALEAAESQYRAIQSRIEAFVAEQDQRERLHEHELQQAAGQLQSSASECKSLRSKLELKQAEVDDLHEEIARLKRAEERLRFEAEQARSRFEQEKDEARRAHELDRTRLGQETQSLKEQIKKLKSEIDAKDEAIQSIQLELSSKNKELNAKVTAARKQELDKILVLEQKRKSLETTLKESLHERALLKAELDKHRRQTESVTESKLSLERELMLVRAKLESQAESIEEFEKIRRQHLVLHEEVNRLRAEGYDLAAANKELTRVASNTKEECTRLKEALEQERRNAEETRLSHEKLISKMARKFDDERTELRDKLMALERENTKLRVAAKSGAEVRQGLNEYNRARAKQYSKIAHRLGVLLEQLKIEHNNNNREVVKDNDDKRNTDDHEPHKNLRRELESIQRKQAELEACLAAKPSTSKVVAAEKRWHVRVDDD